MTERQLRLEIAACGERLYRLGFVPATDGNISCRVSENTILITPSGVSKGELKPDDLVLTNLEGKVLRGALKPSSELVMHLTVYRMRPDLHAVVHAHPPYATAFALAHEPLSMPALPEVIVTILKVPLTEYATPGTAEVGRAVSKLINDYKAMLLRNHGVLAAGKSLKDAFHNMERIEHFAKIVHLARQLGGEKNLDEQQLRTLLKTWGVG